MNIVFNVPDNKVSDFNMYFKRHIPKEDDEMSDIDHFKSWIIGLTKDALINGQIKISHDDLIIDEINIT